MSDFRRFCFMYAFVCVGSAVASWISLGKPLGTASVTGTMFIASVAGAISVILAGKKDATP